MKAKDHIKGKRVKCSNCGNVWNYTGTKKVKATCPDCNLKTPINKPRKKAG